MSQTSKKTEILICKKWKAIAYEENGELYNAPENFSNHSITFFSNHTVINVQPNYTVNGIWSFNKKTETVTIKDKDQNIEILFKIIELSNDKLIYQIINGERVLNITLIPDTEN